MIKDSLKKVHQEIQQSCERNERTAESVMLLAVSKRHSCESIRQTYACDQTAFGENYLNEALEKQEQLADLSIDWHFIGHIQSNKTKKIAEHFAWAHAVDNVKVARRLSNQRPESLPPLNICLQINIDNEQSKSGFHPRNEEILSVAMEIQAFSGVSLRGLMCIPEQKTTRKDEIKTFSAMIDIKNFLNENGISIDTLSMGMSGDLDSAIACGSTIVRVGTAIFGQRQ